MTTYSDDTAFILTAALDGTEYTLPVRSARWLIDGTYIRIGNDGETVDRMRTGVRRILAVGRLPLHCQPVFDALNRRIGDGPRAKWGDSVTVEILHEGKIVSTAVWHRTQMHVHSFNPGSEDQNSIWALIDVSGYRLPCTPELVTIQHANCMMCGKEKVPGKASRGPQGDVVVLCDDCIGGLASIPAGSLPRKNTVTVTHD